MRKKPKIFSLLGLREIVGKTRNFLGILGSKTTGNNYDLIVEYSNDWIYLTDTEGNFTYVSPTCEVITGYKPAEFIADNGLLSRIVHPDDLLNFKSHSKENIFKEDADEVEFRIISRENKTVWIGHKCRPVLDKQGNYIGRRGTNRDITDRKLIQEELLRSKQYNIELFEQLNNLTSQVPGVVYQYRLYKNGKSAFPYSSKGMWGIYEVTPEEVQFDASPVFTRLHPDDYEYIVKTIMESAEKLTNYESEFRVILPQQGLRWRHCNAKPERLEDGSTRWHGIITDITPRKMAEAKLKESEERFRTIVEGAPDPIFIQTENNFAYLNKPALKLFGAESESEIIGTPVIDRFHPDFSEKVRERIHRLNIERKSVPSPLEQKIIQKNGDELWVETTGEPILFNGKNGGLVFLRDISHRKKTEEKLAQSHNLMSYIIEHDHNAIVVFNKNMEYIYVSQHYLKDFHLEKISVIGKNHYKICPSLPEKWKEAHQKSLKGEVVNVDEEIFTNPDGSIDWTRWECRPWYESNGSIGGIVIYSELITDRKQKEHEIKILNQKLEILVDSIQKLSAAQSMASVQAIVTRSARQLIGADGATIVFKENEYCHYVDEDTISPLWKGKRFPMKSCISGWAMENRKPVTIDDIYKDDRIHIDIYSKTFVKSMAMVPIMINEPIGAIGTYWQSTHKPNKNELQLLQTLSDAAARAIENIKLYSELEERVKLRTEQLRAVNRELETFTYSVSHDLKAPLRGIDGYSKLLQDEYGDKLGDEAAHFINTIRSSTLQMNLLIEDLLNYSRLERTDFKLEKIALKPFMEILINNYGDEFKKNNFTVETNVPEVEIVADATGLSIILRNFIENAIKFSKGKEKPIMKVNFVEKPDSWTIEVQDSGVGFEMKYHDRIFEIFQRLHRTEEFPGTGIGLAMVAKAAQRMGGKVWATSIPGEGSSFFVEIPKNSSI